MTEVGLTPDRHGGPVEPAAGPVSDGAPGHTVPWPGVAEDPVDDPDVDDEDDDDQDDDESRPWYRRPEGTTPGYGPRRPVEPNYPASLDITDRLRQLRKWMGLTQEELAAELGITVFTLSQRERARTSTTLEDAIAWAEALRSPYGRVHLALLEGDGW